MLYIILVIGNASLIHTFLFAATLNYRVVETAFACILEFLTNCEEF